MTGRKALIILMLIFTVSGMIGCSQAKQEGGGKTNPPIAAVPSPGTVPAEEKDPIKEQIENMTIDDKIGQMLIVGLEGYEMDENARTMIEKNHIGGFILYGSNVENSSQLLSLINTLKRANAANRISLFISVDEEGGRISRMPKGFRKLPSNREIGKQNSADLSRRIGRLLADEVKAFGYNMDYAPVLDINSNPKNPVIGDRAFGSKSEIVSKLGVETMKGIQEGGVIPVVKHFPGHGDTSVDSHIGLPQVENDLERLKSFELIPFEQAIKNGADAIMVAHILLPKLDEENPATLSKAIISDLLRKQLDFDGVVITDDMTMGAIIENYDIGSAAVKSVAAGSDIVLVAHGYDNGSKVLGSLKDAVSSGLISEARINESVYRILKLKRKYNVNDIEMEQVNSGEINKKIEEVLDSFTK